MAKDRFLTLSDLTAILQKFALMNTAVAALDPSNSASLIHDQLISMTDGLLKRPTLFKAGVAGTNIKLEWREVLVANGNAVLNVVDADGNAVFPNHIYGIIPAPGLANTVEGLSYGAITVSQDRKTVTIPVKKPGLSVKFTIALVNLEAAGIPVPGNGALVGALIIGD